MRLGIDFGTTRVVVAAADRGNYPVLQFEAPDGGVRDWFPPLVAARGDERRYGWEAWSLQGEPGWTVVRSMKRLLSDAGPQTEIELGDAAVPLRTLLTEMTSELRRSLLEASTLPTSEGPLEVQLGVPANANTNQRFLTAEAFRWGGFEVLGLLNEPSAAAIEFAHVNPPSSPEQERFLLVYDLGGGTFDASLLSLRGSSQDVLATEGVPTLGGDDFDDLLAEFALQEVGLSESEREALTQAEWFLLHEECRQKKEALRPTSRRITLELDTVREGLGSVSVRISDFYDRCRPAVDETLHAVTDLLGRCGFEASGQRPSDEARIDTVYVAGGGSELPLVPRGLREQFGRRVRRSAYGRSSTAIGLAVQADATAGYVLRDRFTRYFGVWRESDCGRDIVFDPLFARDTALPANGDEPLLIARSYAPAHNVGHFRYLECSHLDEAGRPDGDITLWDDILFPFDPALEQGADLASTVVERSPGVEGQWIEERYTCDSSGRLAVTISNLRSEYQHAFKLGRWAASPRRVRPGGRASRASKRRARGAS